MLYHALRADARFWWLSFFYDYDTALISRRTPQTLDWSGIRILFMIIYDSETSLLSRYLSLQDAELHLIAVDIIYALVKRFILLLLRRRKVLPDL